MTRTIENPGSGPLTRAEFVIVLVAALVLGVIITSTLARTNRDEKDALASQLNLGKPLVAPKQPGAGSAALDYPLGSNALGGSPVVAPPDWTLSNGVRVGGGIGPLATNGAAGWNPGKE